MREQDAVKEFHETFGVGVREVPGVVSERAELRIALMEEELGEVTEAIRGGRVDAVAKELADLLYVTFGTAVEFGVPLHEVFEVVHRSNMSKLWDAQEARRAVADGTNEAASVEFTQTGCIVRREDGKVLKPPTFLPPDLGPTLR